MHDLIDWMVASDLRQWQGVMGRIEARRASPRGSARRRRGQPLRVRPCAAARDGRPRGGAHASGDLRPHARSRRDGRVGADGRGRRRTRRGRRHRPGRGRHCARHHHVRRCYGHPGRQRPRRDRALRHPGAARQAKAAMRRTVEAMRRQLMASLTASSSAKSSAASPGCATRSRRTAVSSEPSSCA